MQLTPMVIDARVSSLFDKGRVRRFGDADAVNLDLARRKLVVAPEDERHRLRLIVGWAVRAGGGVRKVVRMEVLRIPRVNLVLARTATRHISSFTHW